MNPSPSRPPLALIATLTVAALTLTAIGWRAWYAVQFSQLLDCGSCLVAPTILNEAQSFLALLCLAWAAGRWWPRGAVAVRAAMVAVLCISWADIATQRTFAMRLSWYEIRKFWNEAATLLDFAKVVSPSASHTLLATLSAAAVLLILGRYVASARPRIPGRIAALGACVLAAGVLAPGADTHQYYVRGSLSTFWQVPTRHTPYPANWQPPHGNGSTLGATCHPPRQPLGVDQVVLVIVESLSSYQSQAFGGIHDWTPQLDRWARNGWQFTHFLANGKTTEDGLYALLTGRNPIPAPGINTIYAQPLDTSATLPSLLARHGYHTAFLTTGDLAFMHKGDWLRRVGFDETEGHDAPFYDGQPRYHFSAAKDDALYGRALQWMDQRPQGKYLLALETVSSHQPFLDPESGRISAEGAFRYTDAALGRFISQLQATGFLEKGLLIIASDHRAMVPATAQEKDRLGPRHLSRVPFLLLGRGMPQRQETAPYSQQDLLPSLARLLTTEPICPPAWQGYFTPDDSSPPACIASSRAPQPDEIFLQCGPQATSDLRIVLNGPDTHYLGTPGPPDYLQLIHQQRTRQPSAH